MSNKSYLHHSVDQAGVARITMARPEIHNAFDDQLINDMTAAFQEISLNPSARVVVLSSEGKSFSAGADLNWMRRMADYSDAENFADAKNLASLLFLISTLPIPVIARVQGAAFGGGVGLVSACDIAIGSENAVFSLSEVKLGVIPGVISPYVIRAMGERQAGRYMLSGERFDANEAQRIGLLHKTVNASELDHAVDDMVFELLKNGPQAMRECKELIAAVANRPIDESVMDDTSTRISRVRASQEGKEGLESFLNKRKPSWLTAVK